MFTRTHGGIVAAIMLGLLNAPSEKNGGGGQTEPTAKVNRFLSILNMETVRFVPASASAQTYEEGGHKSRKLATVLVELGNTRAYLEGKISAEQDNGGPVRARFVWFGAQNRGQCVKLDDPGAIRDMEAVKDSILKKYAVWRTTNQTSGETITGATIALDDVKL